MEAHPFTAVSSVCLRADCVTGSSSTNDVRVMVFAIFPRNMICGSVRLAKNV